MAQEESDEKKLERIRRMLDNPTSPLSNSDDEKYMAGLQRRLLGEQGDKQPLIQHHSSDKPDDLTPRVIVHHRPTSSVQQTKSYGPVVEVKEKSPDEEPVFPDEELFDIERPDDSTIPEFIEVKPLREETKEPEMKTVEKPVSDKEESFENLPQWSEVEEETVQAEPEKIVEPKIKEKVEKKPKNKPLRLSKRSVVRQDSKEPEIWEGGEEEKEAIDEKPDSSAWEPVEESMEEKKRPVKTKKKLVFARFDKKSKRKKEKIVPKEEESSERSITAPSTSKGKGGHMHGEYTLYKKELRIGGKEIRTVHFFSKEAPEDSSPCKLPEGYEVQVNEKTGVPYIRKIRET